MSDNIEKDEEAAINAIKVYIEHFLIPERNEIIENLICELDNRGLINIDYVEVWWGGNNEI